MSSPKPGTWKARSLKLARRILEENPSVVGVKEQRKLLSDSYPYEERMGAAYKAWLWAVNELASDKAPAESVRYMWVK